MTTKVQIQKLYKFKTKWQKQKAIRVVALMNSVLNSEEFKKEVLNFNFSDTRFRKSNNLEFTEISDNQKILDILLKGKEQDSPDGDDYIWKLNIKLGRFLLQVGRREGNLIITQNWFFKKEKNDNEVAAHWIHEYSHVLGFHHDFENTERRPASVPYALGTITKMVLKKHNNVRKQF